MAFKLQLKIKKLHSTQNQKPELQPTMKENVNNSIFTGGLIFYIFPKILFANFNFL